MGTSVDSDWFFFFFFFAKGGRLWGWWVEEEEVNVCSICVKREEDPVEEEFFRIWQFQYLRGGKELEGWEVKYRGRRKIVICVSREEIVKRESILRGKWDYRGSIEIRWERRKKREGERLWTKDSLRRGKICENLCEEKEKLWTRNLLRKNNRNNPEKIHLWTSVENPLKKRRYWRKNK